MEVRMWGPMASIEQKYVNGKGRNERREVRKQIGQFSFIYFYLYCIKLSNDEYNGRFCEMDETQISLEIFRFSIEKVYTKCITASVLTNLTFGSASMKKFVAEYDGFMDVVIDIIEKAPNLVPVSRVLFD